MPDHQHLQRLLLLRPLPLVRQCHQRHAPLLLPLLRLC